MEAALHKLITQLSVFVDSFSVILGKSIAKETKEIMIFLPDHKQNLNLTTDDSTARGSCADNDPYPPSHRLCQILILESSPKLKHLRP